MQIKYYWHSKLNLGEELQVTHS